MQFPESFMVEGMDALVEQDGKKGLDWIRRFFEYAASGSSPTDSPSPPATDKAHALARVIAGAAVRNLSGVQMPVAAQAIHPATPGVEYGPRSRAPRARPKLSAKQMEARARHAASMKITPEEYEARAARDEEIVMSVATPHGLVSLTRAEVETCKAEKTDPKVYAANKAFLG